MCSGTIICFNDVYYKFGNCIAVSQNIAEQSVSEGACIVTRIKLESRAHSPFQLYISL